MLRLLLFAWILHIARCSCPSGFELVRNGECRGYYTNIASGYNTAYDQVVTICKNIQGLPIIIHNQEHQTYWTAQVAKYTAYNNIIGLTCNMNTKRWEWADGSILDFRPPAGGNSADLDKDCSIGYAWWISSDGFWRYSSSTSSYTMYVQCTTQLTPPVQGADGCDDFGDDSDDGVCYQVGRTAEDLQDARTVCREFGADLASVHNQKENSFIRRLALSRGKVDSVYLGAMPNDTGDGFKWIDGSKWDYNNFYPGFPLKGVGGCVAMDTDGTSGQWANVNCTSKLSVACMRNQNSSTDLTCNTGPWEEGDLIHTPGYPFDASMPCDFLLTAPSGKKVQVEILSLEANTCCDHLLLFESYMGGTVIANLTGEINDEKYTTSSSNFMRVSWQPTGGTNVRGMMMTFKSV